MTYPETFKKEKGMQIISCLGHDVNLHTNRGWVLFRAALLPAKIMQNRTRIRHLYMGDENTLTYDFEMYDLNELAFQIIGLPDPKDGVRYIVSADIALAAIRQGRQDFCALYEPEVRKDGIYCKKLVLF